MTYDSRAETYKHIKQVAAHISIFIKELLDRLVQHDSSKLEDPEKDILDAHAVNLSNLIYGSPEYRNEMTAMQPMIEHHNLYNKHHPEHYKDGIRGMDLIDLCEMICDWKAATLRHASGDIHRSIELNQERFQYSDELKQILKNTVNRYLDDI